MKLLIISLILLIYTTTNCQAQIYDSCRLNLHFYSANSCLQELLSNIVQSNKEYYDPAIYFYSLTFDKGQKLRYLNVTPIRWEYVRDRDYSGIIKAYGASFLLRGDFKQDSLF